MRKIRRNIMKRAQGNNKIRKAWANYQYNRVMKSTKDKKVLAFYKLMFEKLFKEVGKKKRQVIYNRIYFGGVK